MEGRAGGDRDGTTGWILQRIGARAEPPDVWMHGSSSLAYRCDTDRPTLPQAVCLWWRGIGHEASMTVAAS